MVLFLFFRQDLEAETMELMCVVFFFLWSSFSSSESCGIKFLPRLPVFGGATRKGWVWVEAREGRGGRRFSRAGSRERWDVLLPASGSLPSCPYFNACLGW